MNIKFLYAKRLYLLKQKVDLLSERDRVLLLFLITAILSLLWYLLMISPAIEAGNETRQEIQKKNEEIDALTLKKRTLEILINDPETARKIEYFRQMTLEMAKLDTKIGHYNERYISGRDLAALLHDMLKQTMGVSIQNFGTVIIPVVPQKPPTDATGQSTDSSGVPADQQPNTDSENQTSAGTSPVPLNIKTTHYRLVIRGTFFPIMDYLQHLEQLPWQLYWDKFDYTVAKYPQGIATIDFYTLKLQNAPPNPIQGSKQ